MPQQIAISQLVPVAVELLRKVRDFAKMEANPIDPTV